GAVAEMTGTKFGFAASALRIAWDAFTRALVAMSLTASRDAALASFTRLSSGTDGFSSKAGKRLERRFSSAAMYRRTSWEVLGLEAVAIEDFSSHPAKVIRA